MEVSKMQRVKIHELSHMLIYLYVGGEPESIHEIQLKPNSGYVVIRSFVVAEHHFAHACVALAGPIADKLLGIENFDNPNTSDMNDVKERMRRWVSVNGSSLEPELDRAWRITERILTEQWQTLQQLAVECDSLMNKQNIINRNKVRNLARSILSTWDKNRFKYHKHPKTFT